MRPFLISLLLLPPLLILFGFAGLGCATAAKAEDCSPTEENIVGTENGSNKESAGFQVKVTEYFHVVRSAKTLLILPPTGGKNYIDRSYAKQFCKSGFDVSILNEWSRDTGTSADLEIHQGFYSRMLQAVNVVLAPSRAQYVGMLGTSLGGLYAAVAASKVERLDAVFAITAGVPITKIIVTSDQKAMRELSKIRGQRFGFHDDDQYLAALEKAFHLEPIQQNAKLLPKDYGVSIADDDTTVPTESQNRLRDFWKPRKEIHLANGHFWAIVNTWLHHDDEIVDFFNESSSRKLNAK